MIMSDPKEIQKVFEQVISAFKDITKKDPTDEESKKMKRILTVRYGTVYSLLSPDTPLKVVKQFLKENEPVVEKTTKKPKYTRNEAFFEAHNKKVRQRYMDEHDGRTPEEDGVIYIVLD